MLEGLGALAGQAAEGSIESMLSWLAGVFVAGAFSTLDWMGTWWLEIGPPSMDEASAAQRIADSTQPLLPIFGVIGTALGLVRFGRERSRESVEGLVGAMMRTVATVAIVMSATGLLLQWGSDLSPWLVDTIGQTDQKAVSAVLGGDSMTNSIKGDVALAAVVLVLSGIALIGSLINAVLVLFSYGMAAVICGILAFFAATSTTESGSKAFNKLLAFLIAVILFKPVSAIIWGYGLAMAGAYRVDDAKGMDQIIGLLVGLVMISASILALPALVRAIAPMTAAGPRGMGAAAALAAVGAVATGAILAGASAGLGGAGAAAGAAGGARGAQSGAVNSTSQRNSSKPFDQGPAPTSGDQQPPSSGDRGPTGTDAPAQGPESGKNNPPRGSDGGNRGGGTGDKQPAGTGSSGDPGGKAASVDGGRQDSGQGTDAGPGSDAPGPDTRPAPADQKSEAPGAGPRGGAENTNAAPDGSTPGPAGAGQEADSSAGAGAPSPAVEKSQGQDHSRDGSGPKQSPRGPGGSRIGHGGGRSDFVSRAANRARNSSTRAADNAKSRAQRMLDDAEQAGEVNE